MASAHVIKFFAKFFGGEDFVCLVDFLWRLEVGCKEEGGCEKMECEKKV
jgi:hypothetical protein